ncbi:MAG: hypothetical protein MI743_21415 [Sneathiellales bacterium]|nr:hypothetical protein [Sneathiellales bacterium]
MDKKAELVARQLMDIETGWSIGSFGAIGEFHQRADDNVRKDEPSTLIRVTEKGGIGVFADKLGESRCVAYETLSKNPRRWTSDVIFCLPVKEAEMAGRHVLTELGPDTAALDEEDRDALLFDMGLDLRHVDFCVRTKDQELIGILRENEGLSLFEKGGAAMRAILNAHPHRVVCSRLGRVEIYQKIGGAETGGVSPEGPHTHVLPKLIKSGKTHSSNTQVPEGYLACLYMHPANPVMGPDGKDIPFQRERYEAFQMLVDLHGDPENTSLKQAVRQAIKEEKDPRDFEMPASRKSRTALRVTLRQLLLVAQEEKNSSAETHVRLWQSVFDPNVADGPDHTDLYAHSTPE